MNLSVHKGHRAQRNVPHDVWVATTWYKCNSTCVGVLNHGVTKSQHVLVKQTYACPKAVVFAWAATWASAILQEYTHPPPCNALHDEVVCGCGQAVSHNVDPVRPTIFTRISPSQLLLSARNGIMNCAAHWWAQWRCNKVQGPR
eukprot:1961342-Amphidinium_carterae.1